MQWCGQERCGAGESRGKEIRESVLAWCGDAKGMERTRAARTIDVSDTCVDGHGRTIGGGGKT